jgi:murein DD-endopeptidase MepM/ murein hydrolase activator NlpD
MLNQNPQHSILRLPLGMRLLAPSIACALFLASPCSAATWTIHTQPARLVNGGPVLFQVKSSTKLDSLTGTWFGHEIMFSYSASTKTWFALAGVSFETTPGKYTLELKGTPPANKTPLTLSRTFTVSAAKYPKIEVKLTVEGKFTEPSPEQLKQIDEDQKIKQDYLNRVTADREWNGTFTAPADAAISDVFGSQRIFNGKAQRPHFGLDFRVPSGTPVAAMNDGTVLLARPLYFEGNFIVLDHGQGLLTLYLHLSEFKVKEGDFVKRGQIIGLSGGTGRATGPHLHVAVRWQGTYLDPARLMQLSLPTVERKDEPKSLPQPTSQLAPRTSRSLAQSLVQSVFQTQIPDQPVQVIWVYAENRSRLDIIPPRLRDCVEN